MTHHDLVNLDTLSAVLAQDALAARTRQHGITLGAPERQRRAPSATNHAFEFAAVGKTSNTALERALERATHRGLCLVTVNLKLRQYSSGTAWYVARCTAGRAA